MTNCVQNFLRHLLVLLLKGVAVLAPQIRNIATIGAVHHRGVCMAQGAWSNLSLSTSLNFRMDDQYLAIDPPQN